MEYRALSRYRPELMGIAMLWVMCFHAVDLELGVEGLNFIRSAGFGGVDIFILLSAMGLVMSLERRKTAYGEFMLRRAWRILPAYFAVMLPYTVFLHFYEGAPWSSVLWNSLLLNYWVRCPGSFNWYVSGAMLFYALTPAFYRHFRDAGSRERAVAVWILLGLAVCQVLMQNGYWYYMDFFYRLPVFFLGLLVGFYVLQERRVQRKDLFAWGLALLLGGVYLLAALKQRAGGSFPLEFPLCHLFLFTTLPMCLTVCTIFERFGLGWLRGILGKIGRCSLEIYLLNVSVFSQLELLRRFVPTGGDHNRVYYLIMFPVNILLGIGLHHLMEGLALQKRFQKSISR